MQWTGDEYTTTKNSRNAKNVFLLTNYRSLRLAVEAEEKQMTARMHKIDMLEEKIHHTIGNTEVAGMIREKRRIKKRRFFEDEAGRSGGRGLVKYGGGVTFEEAAWIGEW